MKRNPRNPKERIINSKTILRLIIIGLIISTASLFLFYRELTLSGWNFGDSLDNHSLAYIKATTLVFFTIISIQMINAFNSKSSEQSIVKTNLFNNKILLVAVSVSILMMLAFSYIPFFNKILHTSPLSLIDWFWILGVSSIILFAEEIRKYLERRNMKCRKD